MTPAVARFTCPELVGRDEELAALSRLAAVAARGGFHAVLLAGEAGIGKSAVLDGAAPLVRRAGLQVLRGRGERIEVPYAFGPFIEALRCVREPGPALRDVLQIATSTSASRVNSPDERFRAHAVFARAINEITAERPAMIALDDLHWADESSLELFAYVARRTRGQLLLVGAYRTDELAKRPVLRRAIEDMPRDRTTELVLRALTATETGRALRLTLGSTFRATRETREVLHAHSRGNPLFLEEILGALMRRGDLTDAGGGWRLSQLRSVPLPRSVEETVHDRFAALDEPDREIAMLAATIGERFDFDLLRRASERDEPDLVAALRKLIGAQLIVEDVQGEGDGFLFRHALVRTAIQNEALARERRSLHHRVALALEAIAPEQIDLSAIAHHFEAAGDRDRAFGYHVRAGDADAQRGANAEAVQHYERARDLAPQDDRIRADLSMRVARWSGGLGRRARILAAVQDAVERYERLGDHRALARALLHLGTLVGRHLLRPLSEEREIHQRISELLEPLGDTPELAWHLAVLARHARNAGDHDRSLTLSHRGIEMAKRCGAVWEEGVATWSVATTYSFMGDMERCREWLRRTVAITASSQEAGRMQMEGTTTGQLLNLLRKMDGETDETRKLAARLQQINQEAEGDQEIFRFHDLLNEPNWDEFTRLHDEWSIAEGTETVMYAHVGLHRALIDIARDGPQALSHAFLLGERITQRGEVRTNLDDVGRATLAGPSAHALWSLADVATAAMHAGQPALSLGVLEICSPFVEMPLGQADFLAAVAVYALLAAREAKDDVVAEIWLTRLDWPEFSPPLAWSGAVAFTRRYGEVERMWQRGEHDSATAALAALLDQPTPAPIDRIGANLLRLRLCEMLATATSAAKREQAAAVLSTVVAFYEKARAPWFVERLRERAKRLGIRLSTEREDVTPSHLSRREHEVARLVAQGLTNREIAERLMLSTRTAESHVEQIRSKLGFRTRAQIAAWVAQADPQRAN